MMRPMRMMRTAGGLVVGVVLGLALFISALPDIARYSRIRKM